MDTVLLSTNAAIHVMLAVLLKFVPSEKHEFVKLRYDLYTLWLWKLQVILLTPPAEFSPQLFSSPGYKRTSLHNLA